MDGVTVSVDTNSSTLLLNDVLASIIIVGVLELPMTWVLFR